jgi:hypothetical protein
MMYVSGFLIVFDFDNRSYMNDWIKNISVIVYSSCFST